MVFSTVTAPSGNTPPVAHGRGKSASMLSAKRPTVRPGKSIGKHIPGKRFNLAAKDAPAVAGTVASGPQGRRKQGEDRSGGRDRATEVALLTEKVKKCSVSVSNQEKCAVGVHLLCSDTYQAPQGTSL